MKIKKLFRSKCGDWATTENLIIALENLRLQDCKVLYLHTGLTFGLPNPELKRTELLQAIYETIHEIGIPTLCVPTYTFSFCNKENYDVVRTKSQMGALNEYIRKMPTAIRSVDPLMSVSLIGEDRDLVENLGHQSVGTDSTFDKLSRRKGVQFLFFGVGLGDCFTYMHYLEWRMKVPYRYDREFTGKITDKEKTYEDTYSLFTRYNNVIPGKGSYVYEQLLAERKLLRSESFGDNHISCIDEADAHQEYVSLLKKDPNYFIEEPFSSLTADRSFVHHKMVAM